jgi:hypothetical protein
MGMHVRNLEPGEVFHGPRNLILLNDDFWWADHEDVRWRVTKVVDTWGGRHAVYVAEVSKPWNRTSAALNPDLSLCEDSDYIRPKTRIKWAVRGFLERQLPTLYYHLHPERRPGARALREAIWMAGPLGKLVRALETGSYNARPSKLRQGSGTYLHDDGTPLSEEEIDAIEARPPITQGSVLQVEDLSLVLKSVAFTDEHIRLAKRPTPMLKECTVETKYIPLLEKDS